MADAHKHGGSTARYLMNLPEIDFFIIDALIQSPLKRIGTPDIRAYYRERGITPPTPGAFSQALARLKARNILRVERHECVWIEFHNKQSASAIMAVFTAVKSAAQLIGDAP